jgi:cobalt/nickel transport system permease protein
MHITEGIITGVPAAGYTLGGLALVGWGTRRMTKFATDYPERRPLLGMGGAFVFFVSLIPIPAFTGTCSHPCGTPLIAILLGPAIGITLAGISLLLQAAFFAHGGFGTWGANVLALGFCGCFVGWAAFRLARKMRLPLWLAGFVAGLLGDLMVYVASGFILALSLAYAPTPQYTLKGYLAAIYGAYLPTQLPIAIGEMLITGLALQYAFQQRPEVLEDLGVIHKR